MKIEHEDIKKKLKHTYSFSILIIMNLFLKKLFSLRSPKEHI